MSNGRLARSTRARMTAVALALGLATFTPLIGFDAGVARADGLADEAELHFRLAAEAYTKGDYTYALEHFLASNRLVPNRNVVYNIARTFERLQRFADAHRYYVDALQGETDTKVT